MGHFDGEIRFFVLYRVWAICHIYVVGQVCLNSWSHVFGLFFTGEYSL